jgi:hypothetical protein
VVGCHLGLAERGAERLDRCVDRSPELAVEHHVSSPRRIVRRPPLLGVVLREVLEHTAVDGIDQDQATLRGGSSAE